MSDLIGLRIQSRNFERPVLWKSISQVVTSFGGFYLACAVSYVLIEQSYWLALLPLPMAAGFLVRIFIIQHDCGHLSFFKGRRANHLLGSVCSLITFTPYPSWRRQHAGHHAIWNDLDRRQSGVDIYSSCMTVAEYRALAPFKRFSFRFSRHPIVANLLLPPLIFLGLFRVPFDSPKTWIFERRAVYLTDIAILLMLVGLGVVLGFGKIVMIQLSVMVFASIIGVWLFSIQHRGSDVQWVRHSNWDIVSASLHGATFLQLPAVLRWFTGNIGYHHVHHLNPRIPNYRLRECHDSMSSLHEVPTVSLRDGLRALHLILWDEERMRLVTIRDARSQIAGASQ